MYNLKWMLTMQDPADGGVYHKLTNEVSLFSFWHNVIAQLKKLGKIWTFETYTASLKSFMQFQKNLNIPFDGIRLHEI